MSRPRALLLHAPFSDHGGGECVAAWIAQTLLETHDVVVVGDRRASLQRIDARFGTRLQGQPITLHRTRLTHPLLKRLPLGNSLSFYRHLRTLHRLHRRWRPDLWVGSEFLTWLPVRGLQYLHYPRPADGPVNVDSGAPLHWRRRLCNDWLLSRRAVAEAVPPAAHLLVANSAWTAAGLAAQGLPRPVVLHPPVPPMPAGLPWQQRENRVALVGRWSPEKRLELAVQIVERARALGASDLRLSLAGFWDNTTRAEAVAQRRALSRPWVDWHEAPSRDALTELLGRSRYGVHCMESEHFGIAIAELLSAGCVTLVHDSGGAPEIQTDPALRYRTADEAAATLARLARSPAEVGQKHQQSRALGLRFSPDQFCAALRPLIDQATANRNLAVARTVSLA